MKEFENLPISKEVRGLVDAKRIELIYKRQKTLTLTEVADEIIKKGISLVE